MVLDNFTGGYSNLKSTCVVTAAINHHHNNNSNNHHNNNKKKFFAKNINAGSSSALDCVLLDYETQTGLALKKCLRAEGSQSHSSSSSIGNINTILLIVILLLWH